MSPSALLFHCSPPSGPGPTRLLYAAYTSGVGPTYADWCGVAGGGSYTASHGRSEPKFVPQPRMFCWAVAPPSDVVATRSHASAYRSMKYCLALRSKLRSVSPPPGGSTVPLIELGGGPGEIGRNVWPPSTDPSHMLRCVPVPVGPLT